MLEQLAVRDAVEADAQAISLVRNRAAERLTEVHGYGHWSSCTHQAAVLRAIRGPGHTSRVLVTARGQEVVGTLRLVTKKPWAIDVRHFTPVRRAIYLLDMAVDPDAQRQGMGRMLLDAADDVVAAWPGDAIRLDAYDHAAGAGGFYARCGYREVGHAVYRGTPLLYFERVLAKVVS